MKSILNTMSEALEKMYLWCRRYRKDWRVSLVIIVALVSAFYYFTFSPPKNFPTASIVDLRKGAGLLELSQTLENHHIIRSARWFRVVAILLGGERAMQAGDYYLAKPQNALEIAWRIVHAERGIPLIRITIPEGFTVKQISKLFDVKFPLFDHKAFEAFAPEGFLFPDTYFIYENATASSTIGFFEDNFHKKVDPLAMQISLSGHTQWQIITMASILEAEAKSPTDMAEISGILWKRLKMNLRLQVDPAPETYKETGFPLAPIDNPGLNAIEAAIHPTDSPYLYYLSDKQGNIHYAKTLQEQDANITAYLE